MLSKYFILWIPMIIIAFANATFRQLVFIKYTNELRAHQLSTITLIILCSVYVWLIFPHLQIHNTEQAFVAGGLWVLLTVLFEFALGLLTGKPIAFLLRDYNLLAGRIWLFFLLWLLLLPYINFMIRR
jgi:hypothetical protein